MKRVARKNCERVNQKDYDAILNECVPNIHHRFGGDHALSGERHDHGTLRQWLERLGRLGLPLPLNMLWADMMRESPHMPNLCRVRMLHS